MADDWFIRYPKIKRIGHKDNKEIYKAKKVYIEEKVDGANVRIGKFNGVIRYGSRKRELTNVSDEKELGQFVKFVKVARELGEKIRDGYIYFFEYMIPHTIQYDWENTPLLIGLDVWDIGRGMFVDYDTKVRMFEEIGIDVVPLVEVVSGKDITEDLLDRVIPTSRYYNGLAEGVVFKSYDDQIFAKLVAEQFKEVNERVFGGSKKRAAKEKDWEVYLLEKYVTPRRVEKIISTFVNEYGMELDMSLMEYLPQAVLDDVIEEEGKNIFRENVVVDFRRFRKLVSKRCVNVLQRLIAVRGRVEG